jgi:NADH-quinone oxidoreductase subunit G
MAFAQLVEAVPFYEGITLEEIGGRGLRWQQRAQAAAKFPAPPAPEVPRTREPHGTPSSSGALRLGTYRPIWAAPEVEVSPSLHYTVASQRAEISPEDAQRLGIVSGERLEVSANGTRLRATAAVRSGVPPGTLFLATGLATDSANALTEPEVEVRKR